MLRAPLIAAAGLAALALAPSPASADAVCSLQFDVTFDANGRFSDNGTGRGVCAGEVAGISLDPGAANPSISGAGACSPLLGAGRIALRPRRAMEFFAPEHVELTGGWSASAGLLNGTLSTADTTVVATGDLLVVPDGDICRIDIHLMLGGEHSTPRGQAAPPAESGVEPAKPAAAKPKPRARRRKSCRRAGKAKARAQKRCRRVKRRT